MPPGVLSAYLAEQFLCGAFVEEGCHVVVVASGGGEPQRPEGAELVAAAVPVAEVCEGTLSCCR